MILECPSCSKRFKIGDGALGAEGRKVKCSGCGHVWHQSPLADAGADVAPTQEAGSKPAPAPEATASPPPESEESGDDAAPLPVSAGLMRADVRPMKTQREPALYRYGWPAIAATMLVMVASAIFWRDTVLATWPQTRPLYAAVLLAPSELAEGLEIRALSTERLNENGIEILIIVGEIVNRSSGVRHVPPVRVVLRDVDSRDLDDWTFIPTTLALVPNEIVGFRETRSDPPAEASGASLSFSQQEASAGG